MNPLRRQEIPVPKPVLTITVLVVAVLFPLALLIWDFHEAWTPLEREYLLTYGARRFGRFTAARDRLCR